MTVLSPQCAEQAISHLSITSVISPNDHSPSKPSPGHNPIAEEDDTKKDIDEIGHYDCEQLEGCGDNKMYNPEYLEMDGTNDQIIEIPLTFTSGVVPESVWNHHHYNGPGAAIT